MAHSPPPKKRGSKIFIYMNILIACWLIVLDLFLKVFFFPFVFISGDLTSISHDVFDCFFFFCVYVF